jgi:hypothetical protein
MADEEIEDRFTKRWSGPMNEDASLYAAANNVSFYENSPAGAPLTFSAPGLAVIIGGGGQFSWTKFRNANRDSDAATRAKHVADQEIGTGDTDLHRKY